MTIPYTVSSATRRCIEKEPRELTAAPPVEVVDAIRKIYWLDRLSLASEFRSSARPKKLPWRGRSKWTFLLNYYDQDGDQFSGDRWRRY